MDLCREIHSRKYYLSSTKERNHHDTGSYNDLVESRIKPSCKFLERAHNQSMSFLLIPRRDGPLFDLASSRLSLSLFITPFDRCDFNLLYSHMSQHYYRFGYIPAPAEYSYHLPYPASSIRVVPLRFQHSGAVYEPGTSLFSPNAKCR
jgi:hypothetical protein